MVGVQIDKNLWQKAYCILKKQKVGRNKLKELLGVSEKTAEFLLNAYNNKSILSFNPDILEVKTKEIVAFLSDIHIPYEDKLNLDIAIEYIRDIKPTKIILGGDIVDFYKISKFINNPKQRNVFEEINITKNFLYKIRNLFSDAEIIYLEGNHERRLETYIISNAKELYELLENILQEKLELEKLNIQYVKQPFAIGKLWYMHGHEVNCKNSNAEYITNIVWKKVHNNFICGHWHRTQDKTWKNINGKYYGGYVTGCLCENLDYAIINNWNNGFAIIKYDTNGFYNVENKKIIDGKIF